jgi:hypothetical protein
VKVNFISLEVNFVMEIEEEIGMVFFEAVGAGDLERGSAFGKGIGFIEFSGSGQGRSGMPYNNVYCHIYRYEGEKICAISEYLDTDLVNKLLSQ